jgi:hypothetical protein
MFRLLLPLIFSSQVLAQFTHIEMTQTSCQSAHCYSSPAISESGQVAFIDTQNGISPEHGNRLMTFNKNAIPTALIINQNEFISHVKMDSNGQPVVKIGNQIVRYPNTPISEALNFENMGPAPNNIAWEGDVAYIGYYPSISTCDDGLTVAHQIISSSIHTYSNTLRSVMNNHRILADSCTASPEQFVASNFIRSSGNGSKIIYAVFVGSLPNTTSRLYLHQSSQPDRIIADDVISAAVNDSGLAVWAADTNNQVSIYIQSMDELAPPPVLLEQISIPNGFDYNIIDLGFINSGDIAFLLRKYHINSQTFTYELQVKKFSSNSFQTILNSGQTIENKMIDEIRWNHHGINNLGTLTSSIRYADGSEAIIKSLTREAQNIGFRVNNTTPNSQGIYHLGNVSIHEIYKLPDIISDVPVHQNYEVTNSFMRLEDEYFEQGISDLTMGNHKIPAFSATPPDLNSDELTVYHQITQTIPNIAIAQAQTVSINYVEPSTVCTGLCVVTCFTNINSLLNKVIAGSDSMVDIYQRLRTEQLALTPTGMYYLNMYDQNFPAIRDAMYSEPLSFGLFYNLFQSWQPAVEDLLDGNGTYVITAEMSEILNETLDLIERVSHPQLKFLINHSRNQINLYELPGKTIGSFMANEFEKSFEDLIFVGNFE